MICRLCQGDVTWDVQRSMFAKQPTVFLLTMCLDPECRASRKWRRSKLDVIWPPDGRPPITLPQLPT